MKPPRFCRMIGPLAAIFLLAVGITLAPSVVVAQAGNPTIDSPFKGVYAGDVLDGTTSVGSFLLLVQPSGQGRLMAVDRVGKRTSHHEVVVTNDGVFTMGPSTEMGGGRISETGRVTGSVFESLGLSGERKDRGAYASYAGYWEGTYKLATSENADGRVRLIVSPDGRIAIHVRSFAEDGLRAGGTGTLNLLGAFSVTLDDGSHTFTGTIDVLRRRAAVGVFTNSADLTQSGTFRVSRERFLGEEFLDGDWRRITWLGRYKPDDSGWVYHEVHGWVFASGDEDKLFLYDRQLGWLYTSKKAYPWVYSYSKSRWLYTGRRADGVRMFYDAVTKTWSLAPRAGGG